MSFKISEVAFEGDISSLPVRRTRKGGSGIALVQFSHESPGDVAFRMRGLLIVASRLSSGSTFSWDLGRGQFSLSGESFAMHGPGQEGVAAWSGGYRGSALNVAPNALERMLRTPLGQIAISPVADELSRHGQIRHLLAALSDIAIDEEGPGDPLFVESVALAIMRAAGLKSRETTRKTPILTQAQAAVLYELIAARLTHPLSLGDMAEAVGLSEGYFVRAFTGSFGVTPYRYVLRERVAFAERLIRSGGLSLSEVATRSGFADANRMSRTFRQMVGRSPSGAIKRRRPKPA